MAVKCWVNILVVTLIICLSYAFFSIRKVKRIDPAILLEIKKNIKNRKRITLQYIKMSCWRFSSRKKPKSLPMKRIDFKTEKMREKNKR